MFNPMLLIFVQFTKLESLWIEDNDFEEFPSAVLGIGGSMTDIFFTFSRIYRKLNQDENRICHRKTICHAYHYAMTATLRVLCASGNKIQRLPPEICTLTQLTKLSMNNNMLQCLPSKIDRLRELTHMEISNNNITAIPVSIDQLTKLISLGASSNNIESLPNSMVSLKRCVYTIRQCECILVFNSYFI